MYRLNYIPKLTHIILLFTLANCTSVAQNSAAYPNSSLEKTETLVALLLSPHVRCKSD